MNIPKWAYVVIIVVLILGVGMSFSAPNYPGGGEIITGNTQETINGVTYHPYGQHQTQYDPDGNYADYTWHWDQSYVNNDPLILNQNGDHVDAISCPDIIVNVNDVYNVQQVGQSFVALPAGSDPVIEKTYEKTFGNTTYQYNLIYYGLDVTFSTAADYYIKPKSGAFYTQDYGWYYEDGLANIDVLANFAISPWTVAGTYNSTTTKNASGQNVTTTYKIQKGWVGVLTAYPYKIESGFTDDALVDDPSSTQYNTASIIRIPEQVGSTLNMFLHDSSTDYRQSSFSDSAAIVGVASNIDIELRASLKAGASNIQTVGGLLNDPHWADASVDDVQVLFHVLVPCVATIEMTKLVTVGQVAQKRVDNSTNSNLPHPIGWTDLQEWLAGASEYWASRFQDPMFLLMLVGGLFVVALILMLFLRRR